MSLAIDRLWIGLLDTLLMVGVSSLLALALGLPMAVILVSSPVCSESSFCSHRCAMLSNLQISQRRQQCIHFGEQLLAAWPN
jgi:ABC-type methionine transport system permease subunit